MQLSKNFLFVESLAQRISTEDLEYQAIQDEFYRLQAGLAGEKKLKHILSDYEFKSDHYIYYNFECKNDRGFTHQIDALLITPHFAMVFEVKQISGTLHYKPAHHEFFRTLVDGQQENFSNPFDQVYRHKLLIEQLFRQWNIDLPVLQLVVIGNFRAKLDPSLQGMPILHVSGLPMYLEKLYANYDKKPCNLMTIHSNLEKIYQALPARRTVDANRLRRGVLCKDCNYQHLMDYRQGYWNCSVCGARNKDAIRETLYHYSILISPRITNSEFRAFVGIECKHVASKLLARIGMQRFGHKRGAYYVIPDDILLK